VTVSAQDGMILIFVPAGEFIMGTDHGLTDEAPAHAVYLDSFWLDRTEVTNKEYRRCVESGGCKLPSVTSYFDDPAYARHPVVYVSWEQAGEYCAWAGRRLPTEAEWEKAATWNPRMNEKYVFPWGNDYKCSKGNYDDETELDASLMQNGLVNCDGFDRSAPVGSFPQGVSPYGALDMGGNVWEWVHDAFIETDPFVPDFKNYYAITPAFNPQGVDPASTVYRSMRGGSWNYTYGFGRSAYRLWFGLTDSYDGIGFRCAQSE
jgi:formylglycine-generating enzyme required for sulfatase activity